MKFAFIDAKRVAFPVVVMCRVLGVSSSVILRVQETALGTTRR